MTGFLASVILLQLLSVASAFQTIPSNVVAPALQRIPSKLKHRVPSSVLVSKPRPRNAHWMVESDNVPTMSSSTVEENSVEGSTIWDGLAYAIGGTTSILVSGTFFVVLVLQRDAFMVCFFAGSILNAVLGKVMKRLLNQDRPQPSADAIEQPSDKGMPSSHAMSLGFIGTVTALSLTWTRLLLPLYVATSLYYRVKTKLHTPGQVAAGLSLGTINGILWQQLMAKSSLIEMVSQHVLDSNGQLPVVYLVVPALVGAVVVGSLERKISKWLKMLKESKEE